MTTRNIRDTAVIAEINEDLEAIRLQYTQPNRFTPNELLFLDMSRIMGGSTRITRGTDGGSLPVWILTAEAGFQRSFFYEFDGNLFSNIISTSAWISEVTAHSTAPLGTSYKAEIWIDQLDINGSAILGVRKVVFVSGPDGITYGNGATYGDYVAKHADCKKVRITYTLNAITSTTDRVMHIRDMFVGSGTMLNFRLPPPAAPLSTVYVATTGSDSTGTGTLTSPWATLDFAIDQISGNGIVKIANGVYGPMQITPNKVKGKLSIIGSWVNGVAPIIKATNKLTGITKTTGATKVYECALTGINLSNLNWIWQDSVNDARTLIPDTDRDPQHKGRTHRLSCTKIVKVTDTSSKANALAEMDAAADPRCYWEADVLYFTVDGGGDGTLADIHVPTTTSGLFSASGNEVWGEITIEGLEVRYGNVNLTSFSKAFVNELKVIGPYANCVDYRALNAGTLETAGGGSLSGSLGDGLNGHDRCTCHIQDLYTHDNNDDGESTHEYGSMRMNGGLAEYNGGAGLCPAYGCDAEYKNVKSRKNQRLGAGRKPAGFAVVGGPTEGVDTRATFINCISEGDLTGFYADTASLCFGTVIECRAINPTTVGFKQVKVVDSTHFGTGLAYTSCTFACTKPLVLAASAVKVSNTGNITETALATITVPAGILGPNGQIEVVSLWSYTNSSNTKTVSVKLNGVAFLNLGTTTSAVAQPYTRIANRNNVASQIGFPSVTSTGLGTSSGALITSAIDTSVDTTLTLTGTLANSGETVSLESYLVRIIPSP